MNSYGIYLTLFVAPKPSHYLSPFMLPFFSSAFTFFFVVPNWVKRGKPDGQYLYKIIIAVLVLTIAQQFVFHFLADFHLFNSVVYF